MKARHDTLSSPNITMVIHLHFWPQLCIWKTTLQYNSVLENRKTKNYNVNNHHRVWTNDNKVTQSLSEPVGLDSEISFHFHFTNIQLYASTLDTREVLCIELTHSSSLDLWRVPGLVWWNRWAVLNADLLNLTICLVSGSACNLSTGRHCTVRLIPR